MSKIENKVGRVLNETPELDNRFFPVIKRVIELPEGGTRDQLVWDRREKEFSVLLARTSDDKYVLVKEPKFGQGKEMLTVPAGGVRKNETAEEAARREFFEETGYKVEKVVLLRDGVVDFPDKIDGGGHSIFLGSGAKKFSEPIEKYRSVVKLDRDKLEQLLDNKVADLELDIAMSLTAVMLALRHVEKEEV